MSSRRAQLAERTERQARIDASCVETPWKERVDIPLLAMCSPLFEESSPVILLPELRMKPMLREIVARMPHGGKIMIVDEQNTRFEALKSCVSESNANLYFSAQEVSALNYANDIFHGVVSEIGLATLFRLEQVVPSYRRVLRPDGLFVCCVPKLGSFSAFFDIFEECLSRLYPNLARKICDELSTCMLPNNVIDALSESGFDVVEKSTFSVELSFGSVEQLLFSTIVESHFLGLCMGLRRMEIDARELLTLVVRSFHHYFQGESPKVVIECLAVACRKI